MAATHRVALVTGGSRGIGAAVARRIRQEGGNVALVGRRPEPLRAVAEEIGAAVVAADAADGAAMKAAVEKVVETFGGLDILIANAGGHGVDHRPQWPPGKQRPEYEGNPAHRPIAGVRHRRRVESVVLSGQALGIDSARGPLPEVPALCDFGMPPMIHVRRGVRLRIRNRMPEMKTAPSAACQKRIGSSQ